jgi:DNA-binding MurR/RpiR family transcriptional regulator
MLNTTDSQPAIAKIRCSLLSLSDSERKVADWILQQKEAVLHLSMAQVAEACGVSDTTVLRMCRNIGFKGYTNLKIALAQDLASPTQLIHDDISNVDEPTEMARKVFLSNIQALYDTLELLDNATLINAVNSLKNARKVLITGVGGSSIIAQAAYQKLFRLGLNCIAPSDIQMQIMHAALLNADDLIIGISYSGNTKDVILAMEEAKKHYAQSICITGNALSPITKLADMTLLSVSHETRSDAIAARTAQLTLIDALYIIFSFQQMETTLAVEKRIVQSILPKSY